MALARKSTDAKRTDKLALGTQLCFAIYSTLLGINKTYRGLLRDLGITYPQYLVMLVLWERDRVNVSDICNRLFLETTTLTPLLKRLETQGLVARRRSAEDERQVIVSLTPTGKAMRKRAEKFPDCVAQAIGCSEREIVDLAAKLTAIRGRLLT